MPSVVTFWQLPEEEVLFFDYLSTTGRILAIPSRWERRREGLDPRPVESFLQSDEKGFRFGLEEHVRQAKIETLVRDGECFFGVSDMKSCLIGYSRGFFRDGNKLTQSNLHAYWDFPNDDGTMIVQKPPEFIRWAKGALSWIRKATPERLEVNGHLYRSTQMVKRAVEEGTIIAVLY